MRRLTLLLTGGMIALTVAAGWAGAEVRSLRGDNPIDAPSAFAPKKYLERSEAGFPRSWDTAPPMIPHSTKAFKITRELNVCAYCHVEDHAWMRAPKAGESHFKKASAGGTPELDSRRYFCLQCHAPQHASPLLIGNTFKGAAD